MTSGTMKSGVVDTDRVKIEGRQSLHRRKMSKNAPLVNGADDSVMFEEENMVRQVNLAAAYHDHISCTKSADLCKIPDTKESRVNLPCETDHIYANCSDSKSKGSNSTTTPSKDRNDEKRQLQEMCLLQLELVKRMEEQNVSKDKQIQQLKQENEMLKVRLERMERRMCLLKRNVRSDSESDVVSDVGNIASDSHVSPTVTPPTSSEPSSVARPTAVHLVTRYFGRRSKTIPLRALKRRYLGPPKPFPCKKIAIKHSPSAASMSSASEEQQDEEEEEEEKKTSFETSLTSTHIPSSAPAESPEPPTKPRKKRSKRLKVFPRMEDFLTTDKEYYLPDYYSVHNSLNSTETIDAVLPLSGCPEVHFKISSVHQVPSWRYNPVSSFYQMEGTENIDDRVFQRRHLRCEQDEKRRKRWDIQRLREQRACEKLKYKRSGEMKNDGDEHLQRKANSLYPNPTNIEYIEVTDKLPVLAFGRPIPLFQPSEFSLPWKVNEKGADQAKKIQANTDGVRVT